MKKNTLYKWSKFGPLVVYEGECAVAAGNKEIGYSVFADKKDLKISKDGDISYYRTANGFMDTYDSRGRASRLVREVDKARNKENTPTIISIISPSEDFSAFSHGDCKTGGVLLVVEKDKKEDLAHEVSHYLCGHLRRVSNKKDLEKEKEAIETEIRLLKLRKEYNKDIKNEIVENFSTYLKGSKRKSRARKLVNKVEKRG
jgi:tRNA-dihydrouridine synthase